MFIVRKGSSWKIQQLIDHWRVFVDVFLICSIFFLIIIIFGKEFFFSRNVYKIHFCGLNAFIQTDWFAFSSAMTLHFDVSTLLRIPFYISFNHILFEEWNYYHNYICRLNWNSRATFPKTDWFVFFFTSFIPYIN